MQHTEEEGYSRRSFLATGAAASVPVLATSAAAQVATGTEDEAISAAVEALRVAIQKGDAQALDGLTHPQLTYGHSSGRKQQTKAEFIASLAGKLNYKTLTFSEQWIRIVGDNALVRYIWDGADILPNSDIGHSFVAVLQVWVKDGRNWLLLARQSCPLKPA